MSENVNIDYTLDMLGEPCPFPGMASIKAYDKMKDGEVIEIFSDLLMLFQLMLKIEDMKFLVLIKMDQHLDM